MILYNCIEYFVALVLAELLEFLCKGFILKGQDGYSVKGCILGTVNGHGGYGNTGGHLDNGQEGVQSGERLGFHRNPDNGKSGVGGDDSGQVPKGSGTK